MQGCVLARQDRGGSGSSVDVWTARARDFDLELPAHVARVVVWDDLFSPDTLAVEIDAVRQRLADTFNVDRADQSAFAVFLARHGSLGTAVESIVDTPIDGGRRIAVIDINATGPTVLSWKDILPIARAHYDPVISISYIPLAGPRSWSAWLSENDMGDCLLQLERDQLALCDAAVLTSDGLLGLGEDVDPDLRRTRVGQVMSCFINSLASALVESALAKREEGAQTPRYFALGSVTTTTGAHDPLEPQRLLINEEFGALRSDRPIFHSPRVAAVGSPRSLSITLWPFDPIGYLRIT